MFNPASFPSLGRRLQYIGLSRWLSSKESSCNVGDAGDGGLILGYRGGNARRRSGPSPGAARSGA